MLGNESEGNRVVNSFSAHGAPVQHGGAVVAANKMAAWQEDCSYFLHQAHFTGSLLFPNFDGFLLFGD